MSGLRVPSFTEWLSSGLKPQDTLQAPDVGYTEGVGRAIEGGLRRLGVPERRAVGIARGANEALSWTPVGAVTEAMDAGRDARRQSTATGQALGLGKGAVMAALGAVPGGKKAAGVAVENLGRGRFAAFVDGKKAGTVSIAKGGEADFVEGAYLEPEFTGKRLGVEIYNQIEQALDKKLAPSPLGLSANARPFWRRRLAAMTPEERADAFQRSYDAGKGYGLDDRDIRLRLYDLAGGEALDAIDAPRVAKTAPPLAMDEASRMARAREMGFDTATPLYRGMSRLYDADKTGNYQMFTSSPLDAGEYAGGFEGANVLPAFVAPGKGASIDAGGANWNAIPRSAIPKDIAAKLHPSVGGQVRTDEFIHAAKEAGYDSATIQNVFDNIDGIIRTQPRPAKIDQSKLDDIFAELEGFDLGGNVDVPMVPDLPINYAPVTVHAAFNPANIRSRFAAFDPAKRNSKNLLASGAGAAVGVPSFTDFLANQSGEQ